MEARGVGVGWGGGGDYSCVVLPCRVPQAYNFNLYNLDVQYYYVLKSVMVGFFV